VTAPRLPVAQQIRLREEQLFLTLTIIIGVLAGLSAVLFAIGIDRVTHLFFGNAPSHLRLFIVPAVVSVITGILLAKVFPNVRGSGIPQTETAFHLHGGRIPWQVPVGKFLTGVLCIGSGHSMGREGPSVQIGAGLASVIGRWLRLPPARVKELVPVGAAAALSAAFNTPVAAVLFALEEIIGDLNATLLGSTVVASVTSVIVARSILGNEPLFHVPAYHLEHPAELTAYAVLGVAGGIISVIFCKGLLGLRVLFLRLPSSTRMFQPAMGGVAIGALLLVAPQVMGVGYEYVNQALNGGLVFKTLLFLCLFKLAATIISYSSGNAGGIFAPTLYIGAMAGGALGTLVHRYAPFPTADPAAYALVGMGALFAGIIRAPMTSVFMIFEITQDYQILVPLMVANMLSFAISKRYQPLPIYHALLQQDGIHLPSAVPHEPVTGWTAGDVMNANATFLPADASIASAWESARTDGWRARLVGDRNQMVGLVTALAVREAVEEGRAEEPVTTLVADEAVHVHSDHSQEIVLQRLAQSNGVLPVVSRDAATRLEGVITMDTIIAAMERGPARSNGSHSNTP
jgi:chloride channel protein, CIC family